MQTSCKLSSNLKAYLRCFNQDPDKEPVDKMETSYISNVKGNQKGFLINELYQQIQNKTGVKSTVLCSCNSAKTSNIQENTYNN